MIQDVVAILTEEIASVLSDRDPDHLITFEMNVMRRASRLLTAFREDDTSVENAYSK